jgi:hypothetical protein
VARAASRERRRGSAARSSMLVREQLGGPLDLVEDHRPRQSRHEAGGVPGDGGEHGGVVQSEILRPTRLRQALSQRALADLAGAVQQDDRPVVEGFAQAGGKVARVHVVDFNHLVVDFQPRRGQYSRLLRFLPLIPALEPAPDR